VTRIVIRADAGTVPKIGTGHIVRTIKLTDALRRSPAFQDSEVLFATREHPPYELGGRLVGQAGYTVISNSDLEPNSKSELRSILRAQPNVVILDRLETEAAFVLGLKNAGIFVVTFDDLGKGQLYADLAVHPLLQNVEPKPKVFVGYEYLFPISDEIIRSETRKHASKVFVSFGGFDHRQLNTYFLNLIPKIHGPKRYEIIVSGLDSHNLNNMVDFASTVEARSHVEIVVHQRPIDFYKLLCTSDMAIVSGGLTAFGCAQAGVPAIGVPQYEHQLENLKRLEKHGCLKSGARNMELDSELLSSLVTDMSMNYTERFAMSQAGMKVIDGKGLARTVNLIAQTYRSWCGGPQ